MKAKLIIDMPDNCDNCPFQGITHEDYEPCCLAHKSSKIFDIEEFDYEPGKPEWCPLTVVEDKEESDRNFFDALRERAKKGER